MIPYVEICEDCKRPMPCDCMRIGMHPKAFTRWRSQKYLEYVRMLSCSVPRCRNTTIEAAHVGPKATGRKPHDCLTIPLCAEHHRESHAKGKAWEHYDQLDKWLLQTMVSAFINKVV
jgi:hypothetical protein